MTLKAIKREGFSLLELLIVMAVLALLTMLVAGNYVTSLKKGRDAQRKADLQSIQKALELYYEDNKSYPINSLPNPFCHPNGCATEQYMANFPTDPQGYTYYYNSTDGSYYRIYSCIEYDADRGPNVKYVPTPAYSNNCGSCSGCRFGLSSSNTSP